MRGWRRHRWTHGPHPGPDLGPAHGAIAIINVGDGGVDVLANLPEEDLLALEKGFLPSNSHIAFQIKTVDGFLPWREAAIKKELFGNKPPSPDALGASVR